jgi:hypothetical protein
VATAAGNGSGPHPDRRHEERRHEERRHGDRRHEERRHAAEPVAKPRRGAAKSALAARVAEELLAATKRAKKGKEGASGRGKRKGAGRKRPARPAVPVVRVVKLRELDPVARCGPGTSVEHLFRVEELLDGEPTIHLVFFDRHGWYCMHGAGCVAVADVQKELKQRHRVARR